MSFLLTGTMRLLVLRDRSPIGLSIRRMRMPNTFDQAFVKAWQVRILPPTDFYKKSGKKYATPSPAGPESHEKNYLRGNGLAREGLMV